MQFAAHEVAGVVNELEAGLVTLALDARNRDPLKAILRRQRALLGAARLDEIAVVAEALRATEDMTRVIAKLNVPVKEEWLAVFRSARDVLKAAVDPLRRGENPPPNPALSRLRTLRQELLDRYGEGDMLAVTGAPTPAAAAAGQPAAAAVNTPAPARGRGRSALPDVPELPKEPFTDVAVPGGTALALVLETPLGSNRSRIEDPVRARVKTDVVVRGKTAIPAGTEVVGTVLQASPADRANGRAALTFRFIELRPYDTPVRFQSERITRR